MSAAGPTFPALAPRLLRRRAKVQPRSQPAPGPQTVQGGCPLAESGNRSERPPTRRVP